MVGSKGNLAPGIVSVETTDNRGHTVEEVTERCLNRIIAVSQDANPVIRQQAEAYRDNMRIVIKSYMQDAVMSDRTTLAAKLREMGLDEIANMLRTI